MNNIAKFLRTPFLLTTSDSYFWRSMIKVLLTLMARSSWSIGATVTLYKYANLLLFAKNEESLSLNYLIFVFFKVELLTLRFPEIFLGFLVICSVSEQVLCYTFSIWATKVMPQPSKLLIFSRFVGRKVV